MKRIKYLLILFVTVVSLSFYDVNAASGYLSVSASQVYVGDSFNVSVNVSSTAAWNVHVNASGPVSGCVINQVDATADAMNTNKTFSATCTATGTGTITVTLSGDVTDASDGNAVGLSGTKTVTVVNRPATPTPSNPTPSTPTPSGPADTRSTNTSLSKLTVNGKELTNSNNVYTLEVSNYVDKANIAAVVADNKSKVTGTGTMDLKVGENSFNVVVTAERGNTTTYVVKVIRKEANVLGDLDDVLNQNGEATIQISDSDKLTKDKIDKIISSKKKVTLTKVDSETKKILYSIILDGSSIKSSNEFNPNIVLVIENNSDMEEAINYADGIYLDFSNCGDIPKGTILRYFVGDKYKDNDKVNLYSYDGSKIIQLKENVEVKDGYIEFEIEDSVRHLISKAKVLNAEAKKSDMDIWFIVSIVLAVVSVCLFFMFVSSRMKLCKNKKEVIGDLVSLVDEKKDVVEINNTDNSKVEEVKTEEPVMVEEVSEDNKDIEKL